eukprot:scaffold196380_cov37-Attheya_sp.AAC.1
MTMCGQIDDTNFVQGLNNDQHPNHTSAENVPWDFDTQSYGKQIDAVECHRYSAYCSKSLGKRKRSDTGDGEQPMNVNDCRFGYAKCIFGRTAIFIVEKVNDAGADSN